MPKENHRGRDENLPYLNGQSANSEMWESGELSLTALIGD